MVRTIRVLRAAVLREDLAKASAERTVVIDDSGLGATGDESTSGVGRISRRFCYFQKVAAFTSSIQIGTNWQSSWKIKPHLNLKPVTGRVRASDRHKGLHLFG